MTSSTAAGGPEELARFRNLTLGTIAATFLLVIVGGVVRVSESGLGCGPAGSGTHGWPLCDGRVTPIVELNTLVEFSHRLLATVVTILIALMVWRAWRRLRGHTWVLRGSIAALALVFVQAGLGGLTVEHGLEEELVAAHLGLAMILIGVLLLVLRGTREGEAMPQATSGLRTLSFVAAGLVLATIVAGGYMAGTEKVGAEEDPVHGGAHMACGTEFPTCHGDLAPFGLGPMVDVHLTHRFFMYAAALAVLAMAAVAMRRGIRSRVFPLAALLLVAQILLGAMNVWLGEHATLVVAHLTLGTLLWATVAYAALELVAVPSHRRIPAPDARTEASATPA